MRILFLPIVAVALSVLMARPASTQENGVVISNLRYGLVCGPDDNRRICFQTSDIYVTNESGCVYDRRTIACTWYGYSFDYRLPSERVTIRCETSSTIAGNIGNPAEELGRDVTDSSYEFELDNSEGHFFNPQYAGAGARLGVTDHFVQRCFYRDRLLYEVDLRLHYPER